MIPKVAHSYFAISGILFISLDTVGVFFQLVYYR